MGQVGSAVVALTMTRRAAAAPHAFRKVGAFPAMHELPTKSRVVQFALCWKSILSNDCDPSAWICVRLDAALWLICSSRLMVGRNCPQGPALPLFPVAQRGDMLRGFGNLPDTIASRLLLSLCGKVRGVFARPFINGGAEYALLSGFRVDRHRAVWAKSAPP